MIEFLVIDAGPLLTSTPASLKGLAKKHATTSQVVSEIRDKSSRNLLSDPAWQDSLQVRAPSADAIARVSLFARATGDVSVLSQADLHLCALVVTIEIEMNGTHRVRPAFGQSSDFEKERQAARKVERQAKAARKQLQNLVINEAEPASIVAADEPTVNNQDVEDDGEGEWITQDNLSKHKAQSLNLPAPSDENEAASRTMLSTACMTNDYAMQNVLLQMGVNVIATDGQRIKQVRTWVLRCHACFKLCKNPTEKFCPSCGNPSLIRTSITYLSAPTVEHPKGYILHLKKNFQYKNRGTIYSLPQPISSSGGSKRQSDDVLILRPDQKEWLRGKRTHDLLAAKSERKALKADARPGDIDWTPEMLLGEKGRQADTGTNNKGLRFGKDGFPLIGSGKKNPNAVGRKI